MENEINITSKIEEVNLAKADFHAFVQNINHENIQKIADVFQEISTINEDFSVFLANHIMSMIDDVAKLQELFKDESIKSFDEQELQMQKKYENIQHINALIKKIWEFYDSIYKKESIDFVMSFPISNDLKLQYIDILINQSKYWLEARSKSASIIVNNISQKVNSLSDKGLIDSEDISDIKKFQSLKGEVDPKQIQNIKDKKIDKDLDNLWYLMECREKLLS